MDYEPMVGNPIGEDAQLTFSYCDVQHIDRGC